MATSFGFGFVDLVWRLVMCHMMWAIAKGVRLHADFIVGLILESFSLYLEFLVSKAGSLVRGQLKYYISVCKKNNKSKEERMLSQ